MTKIIVGIMLRLGVVTHPVNELINQVDVNRLQNEADQPGGDYRPPLFVASTGEYPWDY